MSESVERAAPPARRVVSLWVPCLLAWLLPGLGHLYLGKRRRGWVFLGVVLLTYGIGLASDGAVSVIDRTQPLTYLAAFDNVAVGPLDLVGRFVTYGRVVYRLPDREGDPLRLEVLDRARRRVSSVTYEYGNTFLLTAGLMNLLLILDVYDIASGRKD